MPRDDYRAFDPEFKSKRSGTPAQLSTIPKSLAALAMSASDAGVELVNIPGQAYSAWNPYGEAAATWLAEKKLPKNDRQSFGDLLLSAVDQQKDYASVPGLAKNVLGVSDETIKGREAFREKYSGKTKEAIELGAVGLGLLGLARSGYRGLAGMLRRKAAEPLPMMPESVPRPGAMYPDEFTPTRAYEPRPGETPYGPDFMPGESTIPPSEPAYVNEKLGIRSATGWGVPVVARESWGPLFYSDVGRMALEMKARNQGAQPIRQILATMKKAGAKDVDLYYAFRDNPEIAKTNGDLKQLFLDIEAKKEIPALNEKISPDQILESIGKNFPEIGRKTFGAANADDANAENIAYEASRAFEDARIKLDSAKRKVHSAAEEAAGAANLRAKVNEAQAKLSGTERGYAEAQSATDKAMAELRRSPELRDIIRNELEAGWYEPAKADEVIARVAELPEEARAAALEKLLKYKEFLVNEDSMKKAVLEMRRLHSQSWEEYQRISDQIATLSREQSIERFGPQMASLWDEVAQAETVLARAREAKARAVEAASRVRNLHYSIYNEPNVAGRMEAVTTVKPKDIGGNPSLSVVDINAALQDPDPAISSVAIAARDRGRSQVFVVRDEQGRVAHVGADSYPYAQSKLGELQQTQWGRMRQLHFGGDAPDLVAHTRGGRVTVPEISDHPFFIVDETQDDPSYIIQRIGEYTRADKAKYYSARGEIQSQSNKIREIENSPDLSAEEQAALIKEKQDEIQKLTEVTKELGEIISYGEPAHPFLRNEAPLLQRFKDDIRLASERGEKFIAYMDWRPHYRRWGSDEIIWAPVKDASGNVVPGRWRMGGVSGSSYDELGPPELWNDPARIELRMSQFLRGEFSSLDDILRIMRDSVKNGSRFLFDPEVGGAPKAFDRVIQKKAADIWKRIQSSETGYGAKLTRAEGFYRIYNDTLPKLRAKYIKQSGGSAMGPFEADFGNGPTGFFIYTIPDATAQSILTKGQKAFQLAPWAIPAGAAGASFWQRALKGEQ